MNDRLEIIPFGRTVEEQDRLDRRKAAGALGVKIFFMQIAVIGLLVIAVCAYDFYRK